MTNLYNLTQRTAYKLKLKMNAKALIQSKTFWFNLLFAAVSLAGVFGFSSFEANPMVERGVDFLVALANIYLRIKTTQTINSLT